MINATRKLALIAALAAGLGPFVVLPASAANWHQPGDPRTWGDVERSDTRAESELYDIYGTD